MDLQRKMAMKFMEISIYQALRASDAGSIAVAATMARRAWRGARGTAPVAALFAQRLPRGARCAALAALRPKLKK